MRRRHAILYDVERWRRNRTWLLLPATVCLMVTVFSSTIMTRAQSSAAIYTYVGAALYAVALSMWLRQRFSYLTVESGNLVVRVMAARRRIPLDEVARVRVAPVRAVMNRPERRRLLPRPADRWLDRPAIVLRLDADAEELVRLRRLVRARCLVERDLVVPITDPEILEEAIRAEMPEPVRLEAAGRPRGRRRRR